MILTKYNREIAHQMIDAAADGMVLEIKPAKRSIEQNKYYWAVLGDISEQVVMGKVFEPSVWHVYFKQLFLPDQIVEMPDGGITLTQVSTSKMNLKGFSEYIDRVVLWAAEHNVKLSAETQQLQYDKK
jgi:hypothetical protein